MDSLRGRLTALAGSQVGLALADGTRLDDCQLVSISRCRRGSTAWVFQGGEDVFVPVDAISDVWEVGRAGAHHIAASGNIGHGRRANSECRPVHVRTASRSSSPPILSPSATGVG